ncbi:MAG: COX15/CtaA family protein [Candidatus Latescibacteria bacterium]|nr:COX15/CtaA family protein [Candidatus Latescibacterota bacterium]MCB9516768.1 COX15/CtaA family protein [Candidatus Latescibacterota bacterium]
MATLSAYPPLAGESRGQWLALGFGTSAAMWALAYLSRLFASALPPWLLFVLFIVCLLGGGALAGRYGTRGVAGGARVGALASLLNLLILGSVLGGDVPGELRRAAVFWVPGSILLGVLLAACGAWLAMRKRTPEPFSSSAAPPALGWNSAFAAVAAATTLMLLGAGGLVTSEEAGLAVVDWPNSYGFNMFLYPLSRMTGGIFYEHAHRLLGSLVGLTTLVLALQLQFSERRRWLRALGWVALLMVVLQGLLGGLRVTGRFTMSQSPTDMAPSLDLAVVHGILGQLFFGLLLALTAFSSRLWVSGRLPEPRPTASTDRQLTAVLVLAVFVQLVLGAMLRHMARGMLWHVSFAMVLALLALAVGARHWGLYRDLPLLRPLGRTLTILVGVQLLLGTGALAAVNGTPDPGDLPWWEVALTTLHQLTGATILGLSVLLSLWSRRLLAPEPEQAS